MDTKNLNIANTLGSECCTMFSGFNQPVENKALIIIINYIIKGKYRADIENIRSAIASGDKEKADRLKKQLPAFTPSGTFKNGRKLDLLDQYNNYIHLDFDKLSPDQLNDAFRKISAIPYTFACFRSPSGNGLKVFVKVNSSAAYHDTAYKLVQSFYEKELDILCDPKCKDITRLCFVSDDPDAYKNIKNKIFSIETNDLPVKPINLSDNLQNTPPLKIVNIENNSYQALFEESISFTEKKEQYNHGNRNNFIYLLASNCNRKGIPESIALDLIITNFDLSEQEIRASVKSAYNHHIADFAKFANPANNTSENISQHAANEMDDIDYLKSSPFIPDVVYNNLPVLLKSGAMAFADKRERDVFLTGALPILSGCLPNVKGVYNQQTVYPHLFSFIIAPAASGKSAMKFSKMLADKYHDHIIKNSRDDKQRHEIEIAEYKNQLRFKKKSDDVSEPPVEPLFKVVFIPANASYAKIISHLEQNLGEGIICETEADTMGNVLKQDWGGYSDLLRKAFQHERVSSSKKTNNEFIEVNEPRLAVALSGTINQVAGLIASAEDGLFSRFMYYAFKPEQLWHDVSPFANNINLTDHFKNLSEQTFELVKFLNLSPTTIDLSRSQWENLNVTFSKWLTEVTSFVAEDAGSVVKRLGLIVYRIAMIFTSLRKYESTFTLSSITCSDSDFDAALSMAETYLQHSLLMFHNLPKQTEKTVFRSGENKPKFFKALPDDFKRAEAILLGKQFKLSERSVDLLLKELLGKYLTQPKNGFYAKIKL